MSIKFITDDTPRKLPLTDVAHGLHVLENDTTRKLCFIHERHIHYFSNSLAYLGYDHLTSASNEHTGWGIRRVMSADMQIKTQNVRYIVEATN